MLLEIINVAEDGTETVVAASVDGVLALDGFIAGEYLLRVSDNKIPTIYDLHFDLADSSDPIVQDLAANLDVVRRDVMLGGAGNDILIGGRGEDWAFGGDGNDVLSGGPDRQASDLLFGEAGDDIFQIIPDALPFITGTEQTLIPTLSDQLFGGEGNDQVLFLGGNVDDAGNPVSDSVSIRYNRFLQRYEFTALVWDTTNQEFVQKSQDVPVVINAEADAPFDGQIDDDVMFSLIIDGDQQVDVAIASGATTDNDSIADLIDDIVAALPAEVKDLVQVEQDGLRIRFVRLATGAGVSLELRSDNVVDPGDGSTPVNSLGFRDVQSADGGRPIFEQHYAFYQTNDIEKTVINTRGGDDIVRGDSEYQFPNVESEWGIDLGDFEQGGTISALEIYGGDGADRLFGTPLDDVIDGGAGADVIFGGSGNDQILGGSGNDLLFGNTGIET